MATSAQIAARNRTRATQKKKAEQVRAAKVKKAKQAAAAKAAAARKPAVKKPPVVTTKTGAVTKPKPVAKKPAGPPSIASFIGTDPEYMRESSDVGQTLTDFLAEKTRQETNINTQYQADTSAAEQSNKKSIGDIANSYAARGLVHSGLYTGAQGEQSNKFQTAKAALDTSKTSGLADWQAKQTETQHAGDVALADAKARAIARRAKKYNLAV